mgnify:CR=1 FL=1
MNAALFKAAKKEQLPGKYFPYGISKSIGVEEFRRILKRQNAYLASVELVGVQGLTDEILAAKIDFTEGEDMLEEKSVKEILLSNDAILGIEKTNLSEERGKYIMICKKEKEQEVRKFLDGVCKHVEENIDCNIKHPTHPEIRRSSQNKWQTQLQQFAETISQTEEVPLPRKPPNAWNNRVIMVNDPESFPKLPGNNQGKQNQKKIPRESTKEAIQNSPVDFETRLKEIEDRLNQKMEEKMQMMEKKYQELEEKLNKTFEAMERMSQCIEKYEERVLVIVEKQIEEGIARQSVELKTHNVEMFNALAKIKKKKMEGIRSEIGEPKKRAKGANKAQINKENESP